MKNIAIDDREYEVIINYKDAFDEEVFLSKYTDYFSDYDYIVGDIAYSKLRLKGFYDESNKKAKRINNYKFLNDYLKKNCATDCKYFVVKRKK